VATSWPKASNSNVVSALGPVGPPNPPVSSGPCDEFLAVPDSLGLVSKRGQSVAYPKCSAHTKPGRALFLDVLCCPGSPGVVGCYRFYGCPRSNLQDQIFGGQAVDRIARRLHWPMTKKPLIQNFERPPRLTWASRVPPKVLP